MGIWILASGILTSGSMRFSNIVFGGLVAVFSFWAGMKARTRNR